MQASPKITIAAATYNRPAGLKLLLDKIEEMTFTGPAPDLSVVIVDNTPEANAMGAVQERAMRYRWPLHYSHQQERGIAHARNRALEVAGNLNANWLAFIDDDEYPDPAWLDSLIRVARETDATAVVGTVLPDFDEPPAPWMVAGGFYSIDRYGEAAPLNFGNTSNVMFDLDFVQQHDIRFDLAFSLTGGEDTLFFEDVLSHDGKIVFCRTGIVRETIVPHRASFNWLLKRWTRSGNTDGRILMRNDERFSTRFGKVIGGGLVRALVGGSLAAVTSPLVFAGKAHIPAEHMRVASRGVGFMMSGLNANIEEYRTVKR